MRALNRAFVAICLCLAGCDHAYPPVIVNLYTLPIEITLSLNGGSIRETGARLPPKTEIVQRRKGLQVNQITVKEPSGEVRTYDSRDLEVARSKRKVQFEVWILSEDGLRLGDKEDLKKLQAARR